MKEKFDYVLFFIISFETPLLFFNKSVWDEKDLLSLILYSYCVFALLITIDDKIKKIQRKRNKKRDNETLQLRHKIEQEIDNNF